MSFADMTVMELKSIAKKTNVDLGEAKKKDDIIAALDAEGVTFEYYTEKFAAPAAPTESPAEKPTAPKAEQVILRLVSGWALYQTEWGTATQISPFILVDKSDVASATKSGDFRIATEEEVVEAYGLGK